MTIAHTDRGNSVHLSEEALNDVLIGLGSPKSDAHLAVCPGCRSRVEEFQSTVQAFNDTSIAWSEAQPARSLPRSARTRLHTAPLGWALAATVLAAIGLPVWNANHHPARDMAVVSAPVASSAEETEAQIAQDNELLRSVDRALSSNDELPVSEYHLLDGPDSRADSRAELRQQ